METSGLLPSWEKVPEGRMRGSRLRRVMTTTIITTTPIPTQNIRMAR